MPKQMVQPLPIRIFHWVQTVLIFLLLFTGFTFTYAGWINLPTRSVRLFHSTPGYLLAINFLAYIYYHVMSGLHSRVLFRPKDIKHVSSFIQYMTFQRASHPHYGKYNPGQKAMYTFWLFLILIMILTGIALFDPEKFGLIQRLVGGLSNLRVYHYFGAVLLACTVPVHIYLALTENPAKLQAIFTGYIRE